MKAPTWLHGDRDVLFVSGKVRHDGRDALFVSGKAPHGPRDAVFVSGKAPHGSRDALFVSRKRVTRAVMRFSLKPKCNKEALEAFRG